MLRTIALFLPPIALLAFACGGSSDGATGESDDDPVKAVGAASPDGIYNTADDSVVGGGSDKDDPADAPADAPASFADPEGIAGSDDDSLDFGSPFDAFGAPEDDSLPTGIAMDMYAFAAGDQVLMIIVMWPTGEPSGVDALALAEIMASRA